MFSIYLHVCAPLLNHPFCLPPLHVCVTHTLPINHIQNNPTHGKPRKKKDPEPYRKFWPQDRIPIPSNGDSSQYNPKAKPSVKLRQKEGHLEAKSKKFSNGTKNGRSKDKRGSVASLASSEESMNEYDVETATTTSIHSAPHRSASRSSTSRSSSFKGPRVITITANCSVVDEPCDSSDAKEPTQFSNIETQVDCKWHAVIVL